MWVLKSWYKQLEFDVKSGEQLFSLDNLIHFLFRENERENQLKHMLELLRINASTHVIDIENVSAGTYKVLVLAPKLEDINSAL